MTYGDALILFGELSAKLGESSAVPDTAKNDIRRLYRFVTGEGLRHCSCPDLYNDAMILISLRLRDMKERKYILKRGAIIQMQGDSTVYTRVNLTDEVAKAYLAKYPHKRVLFEVAPDEIEAEPEAIDADGAPTAEESAEKPKRKRAKKQDK